MTGMIMPSPALAVWALKFLQKSMMFTPCCPSAGPTGGAGVALPAGHCSFTTAVILFAILVKFLFEQRCRVSRLAASIDVAPMTSCARRTTHGSSHVRDLQEVQLHRRRSAEDADHDLDLVPVGVDVVHDPREVGER